MQQAKVAGTVSGPTSLVESTSKKGLGPVPQKKKIFCRSENSLGRRQAKGWGSAETAAAEVGASRETDTGYPPCKGEKKRVFTLSITTIQHAPQGRRIAIV